MCRQSVGEIPRRAIVSPADTAGSEERAVDEVKKKLIVTDAKRTPVVDQAVAVVVDAVADLGDRDDRLSTANRVGTVAGTVPGSDANTAARFVSTASGAVEDRPRQPATVAAPTKLRQTPTVKSDRLFVVTCIARLLQAS